MPAPSSHVALACAATLLLVLLPCPASCLQLASTLSLPSGAPALAFEGRYLYVALNSKLYIVDVGIDGSASTATLVGQKAFACNPTDIAVQGDHVFISVAGTRCTDKGVILFDVSDRTAPVFLRRVVLPKGEGTGVFVSGSTLYLSAGGAGLSVIDISDPAAAKIVSRVQTPGYSGDVTALGTTVYLASYAKGISIVNADDPLAPRHTGAVTAGRVSLLRSSSTHVFGIVGKNLASHSPSTKRTTQMQAGGTDTVRFTLRGTLGCLGKASGGGVRLYNLAAPMAPKLVDTVKAGTAGWAGAKYAYIFTSNGLGVYHLPAAVQTAVTTPVPTAMPETLLPATDVPETATPPTDVPETTAPETLVPPTDVPETEVPTTDVPATIVPDTSAPETSVPETDTASPDTAVPSTVAPDTPLPETLVPSTDVPETEVPETLVPPTDVPETAVPETQTPETPLPPTSVPETDVPETAVPATIIPATGTPATLVPSTGVPETEVPATGAPDTLVPETDAPATDVPATSTPDTLTPPTDVPETDVPSTDAPATPTPLTTAPETAAPDTAVPETPSPPTDLPATSVPETDAPATLIPSTDVPETTVPDTDVPDTKTPATAVPETDTPVTLIPSTDVPATSVPDTDVPDTSVPETSVPETVAPATLVPSTDVPETAVPETDVPATPTPETPSPPTDIPATAVPETDAPATLIPSTSVPATSVPDTDVPDTSVPETSVPETAVPETDVPETAVPETKAPQTPLPSTPAPETVSPPTPAPETPAPSTAAPTTLLVQMGQAGEASALPTLPEMQTLARRLAALLRKHDTGAVALVRHVRVSVACLIPAVRAAAGVLESDLGSERCRRYDVRAAVPEQAGSGGRSTLLVVATTETVRPVATAADRAQLQGAVDGAVGELRADGVTRIDGVPVLRETRHVLQFRRVGDVRAHAATLAAALLAGLPVSVPPVAVVNVTVEAYCREERVTPPYNEEGCVLIGSTVHQQARRMGSAMAVTDSQLRFAYVTVTSTSSKDVVDAAVRRIVEGDSGATVSTSAASEPSAAVLAAVLAGVVAFCVCLVCGGMHVHRGRRLSARDRQQREPAQARDASSSEGKSPPSELSMRYAVGIPRHSPLSPLNMKKKPSLIAESSIATSTQSKLSNQNRFSNPLGYSFGYHQSASTLEHSQRKYSLEVADNVEPEKPARGNSIV